MSDQTTWARQTLAFLEHLGCDPLAPRELPEPVSAEWTRHDTHVERMMFEAGTLEPFAHHDTQVIFDGREEYFPDQLRTHDVSMQDLAESGADVECVYDNERELVIVRRKNVTIDRLPRYVRADVADTGRGLGRFQYRRGKKHA